jgi:hypothetical protein
MTMLIFNVLSVDRPYLIQPSAEPVKTHWFVMVVLLMFNALVDTSTIQNKYKDYSGDLLHRKVNLSVKIRIAINETRIFLIMSLRRTFSYAARKATSAHLAVVKKWKTLRIII